MYDLKELVEYLYIEEYEDGFLFCRTFNDKVAEMIMIKIYDKAYDLLAECEDLCEDCPTEDKDVYESLVLDCYPAIEDLPNFSSEQDFFDSLDNLDSKIKKILNLLSANNDEFSCQLSDKLYEICELYDFY
jgi:hypothetical protein